MIVTHKKPYTHGETKGVLQVGWASWDKGRYQVRSIKWAYAGDSGRISRGAPEIPFDIMLDMITYAADQGELEAFPEKVKEAYEKLSAIVERK